jgi:hypothetical protein
MTRVLEGVDVSDQTKPVEQAPAVVLPTPGQNASNSWVEQQVVVEPTQMRRPWQATIRTLFQALVALATLAPLVLADVYESPDAYPAVVVQVLVVAGIVARVMANPAVESFLRDFLPFLAAAPAPNPSPPDERGLTVLEWCGVIGAVGVVVIVLLMTGVLDLGDGNNR